MPAKTPKAAVAKSQVAFEKVRSRRLFEEVCEQVQSQIASGKIKIGDRLPAERELAAQFGISRSGVREALRSLEIAGLITLQKGANGGSFVTSSQDSLTRSFQTMVTVGHLSIEDLAEAREGTLELVVRLASQRATPAQIKRLQQDVKRTALALEESVYLTDPSLTQEFYTIMAEATGNQVIVALVKAMSYMVFKALRPLHVPVYFDIIQFRTHLIDLLEKRQEEEAVLALRNYLRVLQQHISSAAVAEKK